MARRRAAAEALCAAAGVDGLLLYGANRAGDAVSWLTQWPVTREAHLLLRPGAPAMLLVSYGNHVPNAARLATDAAVADAGPRPLETVTAQLRRLGIRRLGVVGPLPWTQQQALAAECACTDLGAAWTGLRLVKSTEELAALEVAAGLTDSAVRAMLAPGLCGASEHELLARLTADYLARGGLHHIAYLALSPRADLDRPAPAQWPSARRAGVGDVLTCEISAAAAPGLAGQLLRTFGVQQEPPKIIQELHRVAEDCLRAVEAAVRPGATAADLVAASAVVEEAGFTTVDDLVHGFGGGYLPPVLGTRSRTPARPVPDLTLREGMTIVIQPNVCTPDRRIGVQTGDLVAVTATGSRRLHTFPRGLQVVPA